MAPDNRLDDLTAREREVLDLVRLGLTNEEIAGRLGITEAGIKYHVSQILSKLGVATREEAAGVVLGTRARWWAALPLAAKAAGVAVMLAAVAGLGLLAWGVLQTSDGVEWGPLIISTSAVQCDPFAADQQEIAQTGSPSIPTVVLWKPDCPTEFSPDGMSFVFRRDEDGDQVPDGPFIGHVGGSETQAVRGANIFHLVWMPDSRHLAAAISPKRFLKTESDLVEIWVIAIDGSSTRRVATTDRGRKFQVLADGRIAYMLGGELRVTDSEAGTDESMGVGVDPSLDNGMPFRVSPSGEAVATLTGTTLSVVYLGKKSTVILERDLRFRGIPYGWSPDGRRLAYSRNRDRQGPELVLYDVDSEATKVIWNADRFGFYDSPSWTPDGTWMIFSVNPGGTMYFQQTYQALNLRTGEHVQLFADGGGLHLSPDGRQIELHRESPGKLGGWLATLAFATSPAPTP